MQAPLPSVCGSHWLRQLLLLGFGLGVISPVWALRIVLTNDDGFEHRNIQALLAALKAAGHDVILSAPFRNQSGASAHLGALTKISPTPFSAAGGRIAAGAPGVGPTTLAADQYHVDSSPVAAVLYGLDYPAKAK
jgi:5'-nucleotidase